MNPAKPVEALHPEYWVGLDRYVSHELGAYRIYDALATALGVESVEENKHLLPSGEKVTTFDITYNACEIPDDGSMRLVRLSELRHNANTYQIVQPKLTVEPAKKWADIDAPIVGGPCGAVELLHPRPTLRVNKITNVAAIRSLPQIMCARLHELQRDQDEYLHWLHLARLALGVPVKYL